MHIDLNSCFATIEQQANPKLRGKPIAVAAYTTDSGCIVAPSIEAKKLGIKVGMRVKDGRMIYPDLIVLPPDPWKYRSVHLQLRQLIGTYTDNYVPKSIDEFVLNLEGYPAFKKGIVTVGQEIKERIKKEIGDHLTVSIGIGPNRYLAKLGSSLHKPDGLDEINQDTFLDIYQNLELTDLFYIKRKNATRLHNANIHTVMDFYKAEVQQLRSAFQSILGYYWYLRLKGWEIDDVEFARHSYGNSYALPKPLITKDELAPILQKLVEKTGMRLRKAGYKTRGVHLSIVYRDQTHWHHGHSSSEIIFDSRDIFKAAFKILCQSPYQKTVRELAVSCFNLVKATDTQLDLFGEVAKKERLTTALDKINQRWGSFVITPALMMGTGSIVLDRIAFGGVKELEESFQESNF